MQKQKDGALYTDDNGEFAISVESNKALGLKGAWFLTGTGQTTGRWFGFWVNTDAVIATAYIKSVKDSSITQVQVSNLTAAALSQGAYYPAGVWSDGTPAYISQITLTSGSIILYNT